MWPFKKKEEDPYKDFTDDELYTAVMKNIWSLIDKVPNDSYPQNKSSIENKRKQLNIYKEAYSGITLKRLKKCYDGWFDFVEGQLNDAEQELQKKTNQTRHEKYLNELEAHNKRVSQIKLEKLI